MWVYLRGVSWSRVVWEYNSNMGDTFHLKLNTCGIPIANKYSDGKLKRTLKRELKAPETF